VAAPFWVTVPAKVSVDVGPGGGGRGGVFSPESHATCWPASALHKGQGTENVTLRMHAPATIMPHEMGGTAESGPRSARAALIDLLSSFSGRIVAA
jgi:hypothetical protein